MRIPFEFHGYRQVPILTLVMLALAFGLYGVLYWAWTVVGRALNNRTIITSTLMAQGLVLAVALWLIVR